MIFLSMTLYLNTIISAPIDHYLRTPQTFKPTDLHVLFKSNKIQNYVLRICCQHSKNSVHFSWYLWSHRNKKFKLLMEKMRKLIVPTPLEGGGTTYSNGFFFVQSILADRYIHRRVETGIIRKLVQRRI